MNGSSPTVAGPGSDTGETESRHANASTRELIRMLRVPRVDGEGLPESGLWQAWIELHRRGEAESGAAFVNGLRALHRQRSFARSEIPAEDPFPDEHRLAPDPYVAELWKSYKRCICANRNGPAGQLLRELEKQVAPG